MIDGRLKKWVEAQCIKNGFDSNKLDIDSFYDEALNYQENKENIQNNVLDRLFNADVEETKEKKEKYKQIHQEHAEIEENKHQEDFTDSITKLKDQTKEIKIKPLEDLKFYSKMILERYGNGLFVKSRGGLGKTTTVHLCISELGLDPQDYHYVSGHLTKTELFKILHDNRDKIVILDDVNNLTNKGLISLLKSALWGVGGKRFVQYNSPTNQLKEYPRMFEFVGGLIVLANDFVNFANQDTNALFSRVHYIELEIGKQEMVRMLHKKAKKDGKLATADASKLVEWIINKEDELLNVDLRTLDKAYDIYEYANKLGVDWREKLDSLFIVDDKVIAFKDVIREYPHSIKDQIRIFKEKSGYSRREYYRLKKRYDLCRRYKNG